MRKILLVFFLAINAFAAGFHGAPDTAKKMVSPFQASDDGVRVAGAKLYGENCAQCHGVNAKGTGNIPPLFGLKATEGEIFWFIGVGEPLNGMPTTSLMSLQKWQLARFIKTLDANTPVVAAAAPPATETTTAPSTSGEPPLPQKPFTDYRFENPGEIHKISLKDLPPPFKSASASNGPKIVPRPSAAWPKVPKGFKVQLYAEGLSGPRLMRTAKNGDIFVAESSGGQIRVFRGIDANSKPVEKEIFAKDLVEPYGLAFYPPKGDPKWLYVATQTVIYRYAYQLGDLHARGAPEKVVEFPENFNGGHVTRDIQFSSDGKKLFFSVGSGSNVDDPDTTPHEKDRADILVMTPEGKDIKVYAYGIRNAGGGLAINPKNGELWCSVNERDGLGDDLVPDYITHVLEGGFYGWPWWYMGGNQDPRHKGAHPELKKKLINPDVLVQPHHASLELTFYYGRQFPKEYTGDIFATQHGSWNRSVRAGYELIRVPMHGKNRASGEYEDFMTGFVVDQDHVWGRPVGVTTAEDGSLLVSDDGSNSIWRVSYPR